MRVCLMVVLVPRPSMPRVCLLRSATGIPVATMSRTTVCVRGRVFRAFAFRSPQLPRSTCARPLYGILRATLDHGTRRRRHGPSIIHLEHARCSGQCRGSFFQVANYPISSTSSRSGLLETLHWLTNSVVQSIMSIRTRLCLFFYLCKSRSFRFQTARTAIVAQRDITQR